VTGPFESLDIPGLDDGVACVDGVCAIPAASAGECIGEELLLGGPERDDGDRGERGG
jgi:hypothetical protein